MTQTLDFIGIGAQKAGSSWIYSCLDDHPEICIPKKEVHYFSHEKLYAKGLKFYLSIFRQCKKKQCKGEYSTTYLHNQFALDRIIKDMPNTKIIACLRDPIDRAFSHYNNDIKAGLLNPKITFSQAIHQNSEYINRGLYFDKIKTLIEYKKRDQLLILVYEDSQKNPKKFIQNIYRFLEVDDSFLPPSLYQKINVSSKKRSIYIEKTYDMIGNILRTIGLGKLLSKMREIGFVSFLRSINSIKNENQNNFNLYEVWYQNSDFSEKAILQKDINSLENLLHLDLSHWKGRNFESR